MRLISKILFGVIQLIHLQYKDNKKSEGILSEILFGRMQ